ncbi:BTB POZ domain-containing 6-like [Paramuricea clavata]|uniref:BTB POZ domain-containing 6-like n=1 Tax=Paramuricea clavata TaxID=317549 RepID=A0A6S7G5B2_PARCT|nr:BTB POZ domain-containing 6-like [Paramuricea clavata]
MASVQPTVDWQSTKNSVLERNRHMFNNSDMSDISFACEGSDKTFHAHKYVLGTSSAVFHAMFYGELAEKDSVVHLSDTNEESLEQFLRFLYTEECTLTADNVIAIIYLAKKYILPLLNEKCVNFLLENLNSENVLDILDQASRFDEKELEKQCWKFIQSNTGKVVASDSFNSISQTTIAKLLMRDKLNLPESELFQAVLKWIDFQCSRKNLESTGVNRRLIIGEAIYGFRPFSMSQAEFDQHISKSGLLTEEELVPIFAKFCGIDSPALKWKLPNRTVENIARFSRFPGIKDNDLLVASDSGKIYPDRLRFTVNKDVLLLGVRLFGEQSGSENLVTLEANEVKVTGTYTSELSQDNIHGFDVMLKEPLQLKRNEVITLSVRTEKTQLFSGQNGSHKVVLKGVTVTFRNAPFPNNGTCVTSGQFHEIILSI